MSVSRRRVLGTGAAIAATTLTGCASNNRNGEWVNGRPTPDPTTPGPGAANPAVAGPSASAAPGYISTTATVNTRLTLALRRYLTPTPENPKHPSYAGAVALVMIDGKTIAHVAVGHACATASARVDVHEIPPASAHGIPLEDDERRPTGPDLGQGWSFWRGLTTPSLRCCSCPCAREHGGTDGERPLRSMTSGDRGNSGFWR